MTVAIAEIAQMSVSERIQLVEDIWDSIAADTETLPLPHAQIEELDRRLEAHRRNPQAGDSWEAVRQRILTSK